MTMPSDPSPSVRKACCSSIYSEQYSQTVSSDISWYDLLTVPSPITPIGLYALLVINPSLTSRRMQAQQLAFAARPLPSRPTLQAPEQSQLLFAVCRADQTQDTPNFPPLTRDALRPALIDGTERDQRHLTERFLGLST